MNSSILIISHNIFLSKEERYDLIAHKPIEIVGVSLPAWFSMQHNTKPSHEIFCKYAIYNNPNEPSGTIINIKEGYRINLPQLPKDWLSPERMSNEEWRNLSDYELSIYYNKISMPKTAFSLKNKNDSGSEYLQFKYLGDYQCLDKCIHTMHFCEIKSIELLQASLSYT